jgi:hypothetical protein
MIDFAPLQIRQTSRKTDHITRYRVEQPGGKPVIVEASSAAEAFRKSGVKEATRIVNLDMERLNMLASGLLQPEASSVSTSISLDEEALPEFIHADLVEESGEEVSFEEISLGDLSALLKQAPLAKPAPEPVAAPPAFVEEAVVVPPPPAMPAGPEPAMQADPAVPGVLERELTPEEIRRLLNSETPE